MKRLGYILFAACAVLFVLMLIVVGFNYYSLLRGAADGSSAPAYTAFLFAIPFGIAILTLGALALVLIKKSR